MDDLEALAALQEPLRRRLYEFVVAQQHEVSRADAAAAVGEQRTLVAYHLDKLVEAGLLETTSKRLNGRTGPGAGRPSKLYRRAASERQFSLPPRDYRTAAELLATVAEEARLDTELRAAAHSQGAALRHDGPGEIATTLDAAVEALAERGYEPLIVDEDSSVVVRMRNCPFHSLAETYPALVCGMNEAFLEGLLGEESGLSVRIDPRDGMCCTVLESKNKQT